MAVIVAVHELVLDVTFIVPAGVVLAVLTLIGYRVKKRTRRRGPSG